MSAAGRGTQRRELVLHGADLGFEAVDFLGTPQQHMHRGGDGKHCQAHCCRQLDAHSQLGPRDDGGQNGHEDRPQQHDDVESTAEPSQAARLVVIDRRLAVRLVPKPGVVLAVGVGARGRG